MYRFLMLDLGSHHPLVPSSSVSMDKKQGLNQTDDSTVDEQVTPFPPSI